MDDSTFIIFLNGGEREYFLKYQRAKDESKGGL
jgi:hypothetical protein